MLNCDNFINLKTISEKMLMVQESNPEYLPTRELSVTLVLLRGGALGLEKINSLSVEKCTRRKSLISQRLQVLFLRREHFFAYSFRFNKLIMNVQCILSVGYP